MLYNIFSSLIEDKPNTTHKHSWRGAPQAARSESGGRKPRHKKRLLTNVGATETPNAQRAQNAQPIKNEQA